MGDSMLYLAFIGKARQSAPSEEFWGLNFSLQCTANEYRLPNRASLCAGRALRRNLFEQIPHRSAVQYWERFAMIRRMLRSILLSRFSASCCSAMPRCPRPAARRPRPQGAAVYFIGLKDGDTLPTKSTLHFGLRGMGVAPAGSDRANSGHHHLIIDLADAGAQHRNSERLPAPAFRRRPDRDRNHADAGRAYVAARVRRQESRAAFAAGDVGPHQGQGGRPGRRRRLPPRRLRPRRRRTAAVAQGRQSLFHLSDRTAAISRRTR